MALERPPVVERPKTRMIVGVLMVANLVAGVIGKKVYDAVGGVESRKSAPGGRHEMESWIAPIRAHEKLTATTEPALPEMWEKGEDTALDACMNLTYAGMEKGDSGFIYDRIVEVIHAFGLKDVDLGILEYCKQYEIDFQQLMQVVRIAVERGDREVATLLIRYLDAACEENMSNPVYLLGHSPTLQREQHKCRMDSYRRNAGRFVTNLVCCGDLGTGESADPELDLCFLEAERDAVTKALDDDWDKIKRGCRAQIGGGGLGLNFATIERAEGLAN